jgi:uncharacterized PurR-regulated membrane protein YhhQ (DUF165 family)
MTQRGTVIGQYGHQSHHQPGLGMRILVGALRLALPVLAYGVLIAACWELRSVPNTWFDGLLPGPLASSWLTQGHAALAGVFFLNALVNRRYGLEHALWHVALGWLLAAAVIFSFALRLDPDPPEVILPPFHVSAAFFCALIAGHVTAAFVFDRTRGVQWWTAPLYAGVFGGLVFCAAFYALVQPGGGAEWALRMATDMGLKTVMAFVLLVPYFVLRPVIRPMPGFGGF